MDPQDQPADDQQADNGAAGDQPVVPPAPEEPTTPPAEEPEAPAPEGGDQPAAQ